MSLEHYVIGSIDFLLNICIKDLIIKRFSNLNTDTMHTSNINKNSPINPYLIFKKILNRFYI